MAKAMGCVKPIWYVDFLHLTPCCQWFSFFSVSARVSGDSYDRDLVIVLLCFPGLLCSEVAAEFRIFPTVAYWKAGPRYKMLRPDSFGDRIGIPG